MLIPETVAPGFANRKRLDQALNPARSIFVGYGNVEGAPYVPGGISPRGGEDPAQAADRAILAWNAERGRRDAAPVAVSVAGQAQVQQTLNVNIDLESSCFARPSMR